MVWRVAGLALLAVLVVLIVVALAGARQRHDEMKSVLVAILAVSAPRSRGEHPPSQRPRRDRPSRPIGFVRHDPDVDVEEEPPESRSSAPCPPRAGDPEAVTAATPSGASTPLPPP